LKRALVRQDAKDVLSPDNPFADLLRQFDALPEDEAALAKGELHVILGAADALSASSINATGDGGKNWRQALLATAAPYIRSTLARMTPAGRELDPFEEMLVIEAVLLHARFVHLSGRAMQQSNVRWFNSMNDQADRAANQYRRAMQTLSDYRNPRATQFIKAGQLNQANQQIVNNGASPNLEKAKVTNELVSEEAEHAARKALPPVAGGAGSSVHSGAGNGAETPPLAMVNGTTDRRRKEAKRAERNETRRPKPRDARVTKRNQTARGRAAGD
jgi:hypothetical protein